jgi:arginase
MDRRIAVVGAASSIGIRPYDDGVARDVSLAPRVLRQRGLIDRLDAIDLGDVSPPPYSDYVRPPYRPRNEQQVVVYSRALAARVARASAHGQFAMVLGGDCSIVLGCLLGARRTAGKEIGLVYVDAHADFATPEESRSGSVSSMTLSLASGRGNTPLARLAGRTPLVHSRHVVLAGRRDASDAWPGHAALAASSIFDLPDTACQLRGFGELGHLSAERMAVEDVHGFWVHVDADVLNPAIMFAVDSPRPGGPLPGELADFLAPVVQHPKALGLSLSIYDPAFDPDRSCARQLIALLENVFRSGAAGASSAATASSATARTR